VTATSGSSAYVTVT